jgi:aspartyl-tRNA(Asn)/glutamyl-tRNA(Gln) amidotransferase subunit B
MRSKETATDYRYFPEPDLLPIHLSEDYIDAIRQSMPELPEAKVQRFIHAYQLDEIDARVLAASVALADYFETVVRISGDARLAANWVRVELLGTLNRASLTATAATLAATALTAEALGTLILRINDGLISGKIAKTVFEALWTGEATDPDAYIASQGLTQVSDSGALIPIIDAIIANNSQQADQFREGKTKLMGFFVGQVMKETGGKANPQQVGELIKQRLAL